MADLMAKARAARLKQQQEKREQERLNVLSEKKTLVPKKPVEEVTIVEEKKEEPTTIPMEIEEQQKPEEKKIESNPFPISESPQKTIHARDLFIIPPSFALEREENMSPMTLHPVEKKKPKFVPSRLAPTHSEKKHEKKRKRQESSSSEEDDSSSESNEPRRHKPSLPTPPPTTLSKTQTVFQTLGGVYNKISPHIPFDSTTVRNNLLLGIGSIFIITIRGLLQRHFSKNVQIPTFVPNHPIPSTSVVPDTMNNYPMPSDFMPDSNFSQYAK